MSLLRTRWAAVGAAVAVTLGTGGLTFVDAAKGSGERPVTVTIDPCRIRDTRPDKGVGGRTTPLGAGDAYPIQGTGPSGNCNIPTDATGLVLNVTAVGATRDTNLRLYPTGGAIPTASNLNPRPGAPPTPNAVTVGLNPAGKFTIRNAKGTVHIIIDVTAYLVDHHHDDRYVAEAERRLTGVVTTLAGSVSGYQDGAGANSRFATPYGVAVADDGTIYVAAINNHAIRKITPSGQVINLAGGGVAGWVDANGINARFNQPYGVAVAPDGTVYVADSGNHRIRAVTPAGQVTTFAGSGTIGFLDGPAATARFTGPLGIAVGPDGTVYVGDTGNNRIRAITPSGQVTTLAGSGTYGWLDGASTAARFAGPKGVAVGADGTIYVADSGNSRIRTVTPAGQVATLAGSGTTGWLDGVGTTARFNWPAGVAVGADGTIYVADEINHRIRRIGPDGVVTTLAGSGSGHVDAVGPNGRFANPVGVAVAPDGALVVGDANNNRIRRVD